MERTDSTERCSLWKLVAYFLRLGTFGFGGPIALAGYMQRDLVEERRWIDKQDYLEGLAFSQLAPGPLAAQLAIYLGYIRAGFVGATLVGVCFVLPSFLMVLGLSAAYVKYGGLPWMQALFYGIGAAVIGIIARSATKLARTTLGKDKLLWIISAVLAISTAVTQREIIWLFFAGGAIALLVKAFPKKIPDASAVSCKIFSLLAIFPFATKSGEVLLFFAKAGLFVFGSGLAIVPFLHGGVVQDHHWLNERQFIDAVAVAMITPGPVVITAAFIGFLVGGVQGAVAAAIGVFLPVYLMVVIVAPYYRRHSRNPQIHAFVQGVTAAAVGAIAGAVFVLGRHALHDVPTATIAVLALLVLWRWKAPEPAIILAAGIAGLGFYKG
ncbi:MAG TPA: chromate transporter [Terriglobales bacterium]|nr:chromate transporter [Terriglobales bacterium]